MGTIAIQQYAKMQSDDEARQLYGAFVAKLINFIIDGKHPNLFVQDNGLISTDGSHIPASWMNSMIDGRPVVPRSGLLVEFNALLYNALVFGAKLLAYDTANAERWQAHADKMKQPFIDTFLNESGYLYDYVDGVYADPSVRPNMAIAIGLDNTPLDRRQRKGVLDVITRELLTPKGLRSLSPRSYGYRPFYLGSPRDRELALHQGHMHDRGSWDSMPRPICAYSE